MNDCATDQHWMRHALALAHMAADVGEVPGGAVLVSEGRVLGEGFNCPISRCDPTAHAEVMALRDAATRVGNYRLPKSTLYVTIEPCTMCAGALVHARVERVVFGAPEPRAGVAGSQGNIFAEPYYNHQVAVSGGVLAEPCAQLMRNFFKRRR
jgi:tRNA(Arg) A34 adenosine deaminase TadA